MLTRRLAEFVSEIEFKDLPPDVVSNSKLLLLDQIGCALAGCKAPEVRVIVGTVMQPPNRLRASVWGRGLETSPQMAALFNAAAGHALILSDSHRRGKMHPGLAVIPAAVAVGEASESTGSDLMTAVVAGYEVMGRVGIAVNPVSHRDRGFWATGTCGPFGSAAAAAKLLGLNSLEVAEAMGLAGEKPSGLWAFNEEGLTNVQLVDIGMSSFNGVTSSLLVSHGFRAPKRILEAKDGGFLKAFSDEGNERDGLEEIGRKFQTNEVAIKRYACSRGIQGPIEAAILVMNEHRIRPERIKRIKVYTNHLSLKQYDKKRPKSSDAARLSMPFCIALGILAEEKLLTMQLSNSELEDKKLLEVARKVEMEVDPEIDALYPREWGCRVEIQVNSGKTHGMYLAFPYGEPERPMKEIDIITKFRQVTSPVVGESRSNEIERFVRSIEKRNSIPELGELLRLKVGGEQPPA